MFAVGLAVQLLAVEAHGQRKPARTPLAGFDTYVQKAMQDWKVPGLAIAVVHGDSVVLAKGYGVRRLGDPSPVDANTIFAIGSASKAFTGVSVGMLVDEGKLTWDDPVTQHLPYFQMYDPYVTRELRIRDLLTHRSGLRRGDLLWYGTTRSREEIIRGIRNLPPTWSLRTQFGYQNLMFITAGEIVRTASGLSWEDFVKQRIFAPLGMTSTTTSTNALRGFANVASPHATFDHVVQAIPWRNIDNAAPAGSINSNATDMSKWLRFQLDSGRAGGKQLLSRASHREAISPQFIIKDDPFWTQLFGSGNFLTYGFGWAIQDFRGTKWVHHGGNIDGMAALVGFLPNERIGVVILTNLNATEVTIPLMQNVLDRFLGVAPKDYSADLLVKVQSFDAQSVVERQKREAARVPNTRPSLPLEQYAGSYSNEVYGTASVSVEGNHLVVHYDASPTAVGDLMHWHYDTFEAQMRDKMMGKVPVTFTIGPDGKVARMNFDLEGPTEWRRVPPTATPSR